MEKIMTNEKIIEKLLKINTITFEEKHLIRLACARLKRPLIK